MTLQKIGHSCFVITEGEAKVLTDPGVFTAEQNELTGINAILITHEHTDHCNPDSIKQILSKNPNAKVYSNGDVLNVLKESGVEVELVQSGQKLELTDLTIETFESEHAFISDGVPRPLNTGYFVGDFYLCGDSLEIPPFEIELLALSIGAPWGKMSEYVEFVSKVKPKRALPSHDGYLRELGPFGAVPEFLFKEHGVEYLPIQSGEINLDN